MSLRASSALSFLSTAADSSTSSLAAFPHKRPSQMAGFLRVPTVGRSAAGAVAAAGGGSSRVLTGVVFEPFEEVQHELSLVPSSLEKSLARQKYVDDCEAAINEQINIEYNISYVYHAMFAYFDRDNVALKGMAKFFKESSEEEREHAEKLMEYQNKRGGRVKLQSIVMPLSEFDHQEKGDALYAITIHNLPDSHPTALTQTSAREILKTRFIEQNGRTVQQALVRWEGLLPEESTWENVDNLNKETQTLVGRYCDCQAPSETAVPLTHTPATERDELVNSQNIVIPVIPTTSTNSHNILPQVHNEDPSQTPTHPALNREVLVNPLPNVIPATTIPTVFNEQCVLPSQEHKDIPQTLRSQTTIREIPVTRLPYVIPDTTRATELTNPCDFPFQANNRSSTQPDPKSASPSMEEDPLANDQLLQTPPSKHAYTDMESTSSANIPGNSTTSPPERHQLATSQTTPLPRRSLRSASFLQRSLRHLPQPPRRRRTRQKQRTQQL